MGEKAMCVKTEALLTTTDPLSGEAINPVGDATVYVYDPSGRLTRMYGVTLECETPSMVTVQFEYCGNEVSVKFRVKFSARNLTVSVNKDPLM